jgi:hypothetical protein
MTVSHVRADRLLSLIFRAWQLLFPATLLALAVVCVVPSRSCAETAKAAAAGAPPVSRFQRIVVIGASASAGFTMSEPLGGSNTLKLRLDRYLDAALSTPHEPIQNFASTMVFLQPEAQARMQIDRTLKAQPTLVVAPDFLFWFCYGDGTNDAHRLSRLEFGLKLLETIPGPIVVGDIPDCSSAVNGMLDPEQIPSAAVIRAANSRLKQWAQSNPRVKVSPVAAFVERSMANKPIELRGETLMAGESRRLLQGDRVHPTQLGAAVLALMLLDSAQGKAEIAPEKEIRWNYKEVFRIGSGTPAVASTNQVRIVSPVMEKQRVSESSSSTDASRRL